MLQKMGQCSKEVFTCWHSIYLIQGTATLSAATCKLNQTVWLNRTSYLLTAHQNWWEYGLKTKKNKKTKKKNQQEWDNRKWNSPMRQSDMASRFQGTLCGKESKLFFHSIHSFVCRNWYSGNNQFDFKDHCCFCCKVNLSSECRVKEFQVLNANKIHWHFMIYEPSLHVLQIAFITAVLMYYIRTPKY